MAKDQPFKDRLIEGFDPCVVSVKQAEERGLCSGCTGQTAHNEAVGGSERAVAQCATPLCRASADRHWLRRLIVRKFECCCLLPSIGEVSQREDQSPALRID